jgi:hypothetical protein
MACDDEKLKKIKEDQKKIKKEEGNNMIIGQQSDTSSISSSDEDDLNDRANGEAGFTGTFDRGVEALSDPKAALAGMMPGKGK